MGIPEHLTCLLRNLYAGQEATVITGHGTTDWFQIGKGVHQGCILSPCLFNLYAEYIMRKAGSDEAQAGITPTGVNFLGALTVILAWLKQFTCTFSFNLHNYPVNLYAGQDATIITGHGTTA